MYFLHNKLVYLMPRLLNQPEGTMVPLLAAQGVKQHGVRFQPGKIVVTSVQFRYFLSWSPHPHCVPYT